MFQRYKKHGVLISVVKVSLFVQLFLLPYLALAQQSDEVSGLSRTLQKTPEIIWTTYLGKLVAALIIVILLFLIFAKAMKRFQSSSTSGDGISIVAGLSVGSREKILVLDVGAQQIVVGVTPGQINKLLELSVPIDRANSKEVGFKKALSSALGQKRSEQ